MEGMEDEGKMELAERSTLGSIVSAIATFGIIGNIVVIRTYSRKPKLRKFYFFTINLCLLNIVACSVYVGAVVKLFLRQPMKEHSFACSADGFLVGFSAIGAVVMMALISIERAIAVSAPFVYRKCQLRWKMCMVAGAYLYSLLITGPPLLGWGRYHPVGNGWYCCFDVYSRDSITRSFVVYIFSTGFFTPLLVIILSYLVIWRQVKGGGPSAVGTSPSQLYRDQSRRVLKQRIHSNFKSQIKLAKVLIVMVAAFLVSWLPFAMIALLAQFGPSSDIVSTDSRLVSVSGILAKMFVLYNPIIFGLCDLKFRKEFRENFHVAVMRQANFRKGSSVQMFLTNSPKRSDATIPRSGKNSRPSSSSHVMPLFQKNSVGSGYLPISSQHRSNSNGVIKPESLSSVKEVDRIVDNSSLNSEEIELFV